jgi:hypothetical protein
MDRELRALIEQLLDGATEGEKAVLRHHIERLLTVRAERAEKRAA